MSDNKYSYWPKTELIREIKKLKKRKKYGIVWEEEKEPEKVVQECKEKIPILKNAKTKDIIKNKGRLANLLIEGDNYHALSVLNYTHSANIDVIYIDPPYNTGNKDFKYNDNYVDKYDGYKHSKWLSFMNKRLNLAKKLLADDGIIFISIDDIEFAQLKLLCDEIFGESNFITNIVWQSKTGASDAKTIDTTTEYIFVYVKSEMGKAKFARNKFSYEKKRYRCKDKYEKKRGTYYPDNLDRGGLRYSDSLNYPIECPDGTKTYPNGRRKFVNDGWTWKWGKEKVNWGIKNGYIEFKKTKKKKSGWTVYYKNYMYADNEGNPIERSAPQKNIIMDIKTGDGAKTIKQLFEYHIFKYPKPVELIKRILRYIDLDKNSKILDFMAGSGTTGHAVLELNREDNLNMQFILCTNNENNICSQICYPRIKKVMEGYRITKNKWAKEIDGNLKYFKTDFIDVGDIYNVSDEHKIKLTYKAGQMIAVKENVFEEIEQNEWWQIFKSDSKIVAIYFREDQVKLSKLFEKLKDTKAIIYLFSWGKNELKTSEYGYDNIKIKDIPQPIIDVYKEINRL